MEYCKNICEYERRTVFLSTDLHLMPASKYFPSLFEVSAIGTAFSWYVSWLNYAEVSLKTRF